VATKCLKKDANKDKVAAGFLRTESFRTNVSLRQRNLKVAATKHCSTCRKLVSAGQLTQMSFSLRDENIGKG